MSCTTVVPDSTLDVVHNPCQTLQIIPASDSTNDERAGIVWNSVAKMKLTLAPAPNSLPIRFENAAPSFRGIYLDEIGEVVINRQVTNMHPRVVTIVHEMGHAFGLWHVEDRISLMNSGNYSIEPTVEDVAAVSALWGRCAPVAASQ
jgi:hypothetical protein